VGKRDDCEQWWLYYYTRNTYGLGYSLLKIAKKRLIINFKTKDDSF
jgi:hypothetical protein